MKNKIDIKSLPIMTYKYELSLLLLVVISVVTIFVLSSKVATPVVETVAEAPVEKVILDAYEMTVDGQLIGVIDSAKIGEESIGVALMEVKNILGYDPELSPEIRFTEVSSEGQSLLDKEALTEVISDQLIGGIDVIREEAFVMKIGEDFKVAVASIDEAEAVLQAAQNNFVQGASSFVVNLEAKSYNSLVLTPVIHEVQSAVSVERQFLTSSKASDLASSEDAELSEEELKEEDIYVEEDAVFDPMYDGETQNVTFSESVVVAPSYVEPGEIMSVEEATAMITKENEKPKLYSIQSGDCPSTIAEDHNMTLSQLYSMNEGLEENASKIQVGQELVVTVPIPELSVTTYEEVVYSESIPRGTTTVEDHTTYAGNKKTTYAGYDGSKEVTATLKKVNGKIVERTITNEVVTLEPEARVVSVGAKPLPPKGATGTYIPPLESYTLSSKFGYRWGGFHYGVDMAAATGTSIRATDGGVVTYAGWMGNYGYLVIIDHGNGVTSRYGHCSSLYVSVNDYVAKYESIAAVGSTGQSTGPHVHFEIRFDGVAADPLAYLDY